MRASTSTTSANGFPSSSTPTVTSRRRSRSSAPPAVCGGKLLRERFGSKNPRAQMLRFHTQTAGSSLTAQQPNVNVVRTTLQALAAVLGGTQSLHCNALDEALGLPSEETAELALRTQQVIAFESGVARHRGSAGRILRHRIADRFAFKKRPRSLSKKSTSEAEPSRPSRPVGSSAKFKTPPTDFRKASRPMSRRSSASTPTRKTRQVPIEIFHIDPKIEKEQVERLTALKSKRNSKRLDAALDRVEQTARRDENLMPLGLGSCRSLRHPGRVIRPSAQRIWRVQRLLIGTGDSRSVHDCRLLTADWDTVAFEPHGLAKTRIIR